MTISHHFFVSWLGGVELSPLSLLPLNDLLFQPRMMMNDDECGAVGVMLGKRNRSTRKGTFLSAVLSTSNPTWPDQGSNPGSRGGKPATNHLNYGTAKSHTAFIEDEISCSYFV
jgi:hypothetical protein